MAAGKVSVLELAGFCSQARSGPQALESLNLMQHPSVMQHGKPLTWHDFGLAGDIIYRCDLRSAHAKRTLLQDTMTEGKRKQKRVRTVAVPLQDDETPMTLVDCSTCHFGFQHFQHLAKGSTSIYSMPNMPIALADSLADLDAVAPDDYLDDNVSCSRAPTMADAQQAHFFQNHQS